VLAATTIPSIWAEASVATDVLQKIGMNVDLLALEWGAVVSRRASKEPPDKGGWNIFYTNLGGFGNISPGPNIAIRGSGGNAWFGWPTDPEMEALRDRWFAAPDLTSQQKVCRAMCRSVCSTSPPPTTNTWWMCMTAGRNSTA
jgi:peptide/nickel transport system substrate-binding protein